jgi:translation initiation factor 5
MCYELGVAKEKSTIIKGKHSYEDLLVILDSFIKKYIICPKCKLAEMSLFTEKKLLKGCCRACGKVAKLDNVHKITNHIIRNIPKDMSEIETRKFDENESDSKASKKAKKGKKDKKDKENAKEEVDDDELTLISKDAEGKFRFNNVL